jgi:hypothetical protein
MTLNISWEEPTSRLEARTAFLFISSTRPNRDIHRRLWRPVR